MRLTGEQKRILDGKEGGILQQALISLVKYATAIGAEEFIPISSAHTFFISARSAAEYFPPRRVQLTEEQVAKFCEQLVQIQVRAKTTLDPPALADLERWRQMGATEATCNSVRQVLDISRSCGILANWTCIPYLEDNIPVMGEHCSWSESSALIYCNSILGARTNRDAGQASFFSALLGITPKFGMHLDENRKGTHLIDVRCEINTASDWGVLGYFAGEIAGEGSPVFTNLKRPTVEEAKQLCAAINVPGGSAMFHIVGITPEAPTIEAAFGRNVPRGTYIFDESDKKRIYELINYEPEGKVNMVFLGCPHNTLQEIKEISHLIRGKHVARDTKFWVMTAHSIRATAERIGYAQTIRDCGGELFADGCLPSWYFTSKTGKPLEKPNLERVATNSVKQALGVRRSLSSKMFFGDTKRCVQVAVEGGV
ncbi:aconitase X catalytic domain-containing protein [Thermodesulfobacteriota bacterium]